VRLQPHEEDRRIESGFSPGLTKIPGSTLSAVWASPVAFALDFSYAREMDLLTHDELVRLTPPERLALISQLWDSLEDGQLPLTAPQRAELDSRLANARPRPAQGHHLGCFEGELEQRCP